MKSTDKLFIPLAIAAVVASSVALAAQRMGAADIAKTFSGVTLDGIYHDGAYFNETYDEDGSVRYHDIKGADSGRWSVRGDRFCTFYRNQQGACFFVERDGSNCYTFYEAVEGDAEKPQDDWTSRGWDRESAATCPTAPEVAI
jgi:hypothetical protein